MRAVLSWIAIGWGLLLCLSLVSMMTVFMNETQPRMDGLLRLQVAALPLVCAALMAYLWRARRLAGGSGGLRLLWQHTPGWLVFAVLSVASLTLIAELTFVLIVLLKDTPQPWFEHLPAVMALLSVVTAAAAAASLNLEAAQERSTEARPRR